MNSWTSSCFLPELSFYFLSHVLFLPFIMFIIIMLLLFRTWFFLPFKRKDEGRRKNNFILAKTRTTSKLWSTYIPYGCASCENMRLWGYLCSLIITSLVFHYVESFCRRISIGKINGPSPTTRCKTRLSALWGPALWSKQPHAVVWAGGRIARKLLSKEHEGVSQQ